MTAAAEAGDSEAMVEVARRRSDFFPREIDDFLLGRPCPETQDGVELQRRARIMGRAGSIEPPRFYRTDDQFERAVTRPTQNLEWRQTAAVVHGRLAFWWICPTCKRPCFHDLRNDSETAGDLMALRDSFRDGPYTVTEAHLAHATPHEHSCIGEHVCRYTAPQDALVELNFARQRRKPRSMIDV